MQDKLSRSIMANSNKPENELHSDGIRIVSPEEF
jgi:hypothetical protein